jgi:hypothetical protein
MKHLLDYNHKLLNDWYDEYGSLNNWDKEILVSLHNINSVPPENTQYDGSYYETDFQNWA